MGYYSSRYHASNYWASRYYGGTPAPAPTPVSSGGGGSGGAGGGRIIMAPRYAQPPEKKPPMFGDDLPFPVKWTSKQKKFPFDDALVLLLGEEFEGEV